MWNCPVGGMLIFVYKIVPERLERLLERFAVTSAVWTARLYNEVMEGDLKETEKRGIFY
jgi:hypothetical protein